MKHVLLMMICLATAGAAADEPRVAGQWTVRSSVQGHESEMVCTVSQTGAELKGSCKSERGLVEMTGKVAEAQVTMQFKTEHEGQELTVIYEGKLESAEKIVGLVDVQPIAVVGDFTATKSK